MKNYLLITTTFNMSEERREELYQKALEGTITEREKDEISQNILVEIGLDLWN